ncbi:carboxynorspermidine decarboxylase [Lewinellaceae bacterium SD302]|nr:carboxynorspermidine decarboxylase [Lewinellaceae bacterium SD302]
MPPSPSYILEEEKLIANLELMQAVAASADVTIIQALKAYAFWPTFPLLSKYLHGATASSLNEALLIKKHWGVKPHVYAPAYFPEQFAEIAGLAGHLTFNSLGELERYRQQWEAAGLSVGLRVNPEYSPVTTDLYNPASPYGRLGETLPNLPPQPPSGLEGLHVHVLCESSAAATATLLAKIDSKFSHYLKKMKWLNLGGGHLMTKEGYELQILIDALNTFKAKYPEIEIIMEPGSAAIWQTGYLKSRVLDVIENYGRRTAMLDVSFTCHMPDTLEMPYRPVVRGASAEKTETGYAYLLGGVSCLAGDYLDEYWFSQPLLAGDEVIFEDMLHYTTVKTTTFNGVHHPALCIQKEDGSVNVLRKFDYLDYEKGLG